MRDWSLGPGDPLSLSLSADVRIDAVDPANDQIWELEFGGEPPALALRTTAGLRARSLRLFPRFQEGHRAVADPLEFAAPPRVRRFYPDLLALTYVPLPGLHAAAEYRAISSQIVGGRLTLVNHTSGARRVRFDWCGQLLPLEGRPFNPVKMQMVNVLSGESGGLAPVLFLTGGPGVGDGPYPALRLDLDLGPGETRQFTWVHAALANAEASFELARRIAARPWEAERARIELTHSADTVEIHTGDPDWDAALAFAQSEALRLLLPASDRLPNDSFVLTRRPDQGASSRGDGSDAPPAWSGQTPFGALTLTGLLPGAPRVGAGLLRNFLAVQLADGFIDGRPGLAGQRARWLAAPMLSTLAWRLHQASPDPALLEEAFPKLAAFARLWFAPERDRDGDGFPEWDHPLQTGYEDNPAFALWSEGDQAAEIGAVESPALGALLCAEVDALARIAETFGRAGEIEDLVARAALLRQRVDECWSPGAGGYCYRDRDTHLSAPARVVARKRGDGRLRVAFASERPARLVVQVRTRGGAPRRPRVLLREHFFAEPAEILERADFQWQSGGATATSRKTYTRVGGLEVEGLQTQDRVIVRTLDTSVEDHTLLLPLWAGLPDAARAQALIGRGILNAERFDRPFGLAACPSLSQVSAAGLAVHLPWNALIAEGLLAYGFRVEAARLVAHLMSAVVQNLKQQRSVFQAYHAETGAPLGERGALSGHAPVGLFLDVLGVRFLGAERVRLEGRNPFPWSVTVRYRGLTVVRRAEDSEVLFPDGRSVTVTDPAPCVVEL